MTTMNEQIKLPELQATMQQFQQETMKMGMAEETCACNDFFFVFVWDRKNNSSISFFIIFFIYLFVSFSPKH